MGPTGIYRCDIETVAVHDNDMRETVYVGLYTSDGGKYSVQYNIESVPIVCERPQGRIIQGHTSWLRLCWLSYYTCILCCDINQDNVRVVPINGVV